jgi:hypothetical protein
MSRLLRLRSQELFPDGDSRHYPIYAMDYEERMNGPAGMPCTRVRISGVTFYTNESIYSPDEQRESIRDVYIPIKDIEEAIRKGWVWVVGADDPSIVEQLLG